MHLFIGAAATDSLGYYTPGLVWTLWQWGDRTESLSSQDLSSCQTTDTKAQEMCVECRRWWKGLWRETGGWVGLAYRVGYTPEGPSARCPLPYSIPPFTAWCCPRKALSSAALAQFLS